MKYHGIAPRFPKPLTDDQLVAIAYNKAVHIERICRLCGAHDDGDVWYQYVDGHSIQRCHECGQ